MAYIKIKKPTKTIDVNGKRYYSYFGGIVPLSDAKKKATSVRKNGFYAVIRTFDGKGGATGEKGYMVYIRSKIKK
jgi:hypothetical protein